MSHSYVSRIEKRADEDAS
nr:hypothetical protein [Bacillus atrophaeus]